MTPDEIKRCEGLAAAFRAQTGAPIYIPQSMYKQLVLAGCSVKDLAPTPLIPTVRARR